MFLIIYYFSVNKHIMFRHTDHVKEIIKINNENLSYKRIKYEIDQKKKPFFINKKNKINILVMGDSHSIDILNSLKQYEINKPKNFEIKYHFLNETCLIKLIDNDIMFKNIEINGDKVCTQQINLFLKSKNFKKSDIIIYSIYWTKFLPDYILKFNDYIKTKNKKIIFMGPNASFTKRPYEIIFKSDSIKQSNSFAFNNLDKNVLLIESKLKKFFKNHKIPFLSKLIHVCPETINTCELVLKDRRLSYMDTNHWTMEGAIFFGKKIFSEDLEKLLKNLTMTK